MSLVKIIVVIWCSVGSARGNRLGKTRHSYCGFGVFSAVGAGSDLGFQRYKFMVQVILGEQHGAGVKTGARCLWDADTDNYASAIFINEQAIDLKCDSQARAASSKMTIEAFCLSYLPIYPQAATEAVGAVFLHDTIFCMAVVFAVYFY
uniref:Uncharacterized protein n=1 Tax=Timema douglasi TaxID=61478 RepID=A0A7R8ZC80_TIMDO|nr:unnamed protein product [Timema douglasi]